MGVCDSFMLAEILDAQWLGSRTPHTSELLENLHRHGGQEKQSSLAKGDSTLELVMDAQLHWVSGLCPGTPSHERQHIMGMNLAPGGLLFIWFPPYSLGTRRLCSRSAADKTLVANIQKSALHKQLTEKA